MKELLEKLVLIASRLDKRGLVKQADAVDSVVEKLAAEQMWLWPRLSPMGPATEEEFEEKYTTRAEELVPKIESYYPWEKEEDYGKLYHATVSMPEIHEEGFRSRRETGIEGLGGGGSASERLTSITYNPEAANAIADQLVESVPIARGKVDIEGILDILYDRSYGMIDDNVIIKYFNLDDRFYDAEYDEILEEVKKRVKNIDDKWDMYVGLLDQLSKEMVDADQRYLIDMVIASDREDVAKIDVEKIGVVPVAVRKGTEAFHEPGEEELRVPPESLTVGDYPYIEKYEKERIG